MDTLMSNRSIEIRSLSFWGATVQQMYLEAGSYIKKKPRQGERAINSIVNAIAQSSFSFPNIFDTRGRLFNWGDTYNSLLTIHLDSPSRREAPEDQEEKKEDYTRYFYVAVAALGVGSAYLGYQYK